MKKKWKRIMIIILVLLISPIFVAWYALAQPVWGSNTISDKKVDSERLKKHVVTLVEDFYPRHSKEMANLNKSADYIMEELTKAGAKVSVQKYNVNQREYKNVIGLFGPDTKERIVVGAHYDSCGFTPGADDNASGVAGLIELAYLYQKYPPEKTIELVAYTLEEPPYFATEDMGSAWHAKLAHKEDIKIKLMISLEMIGYFTDKKEQKFPFPLLKLCYPSQGNFIAIVSRFEDRSMTRVFKKGMKGTSSLPIYSMNAPSIVQGIDFSDHRNYWPYDIPALMVTDTSFYRNFEYHEEGDTPDRLDYQKMAQVVIGVYEAIHSLHK